MQREKDRSQREKERNMNFNEVIHSFIDSQPTQALNQQIFLASCKLKAKDKRTQNTRSLSDADQSSAEIRGFEDGGRGREEGPGSAIILKTTF